MSEIASVVTIWLEYLNNQGRSSHTLKAYRRAWHHLAEWYETHYNEACDPTRLIGRDIRDWKSHQLTIEKAAPSTINQRLVALSSFYSWVAGGDKVSRDPTAGISTVRLPQRQPKSLSTQQLRQLLRAVHHGGSLRATAMIELLVGTGLRVGELLQLQVEDIVLRDRSGWVTVRESKHGGYRKIPLTKEIRQALSDYLEIHPYSQKKHEAYLDSRAPLWWGKHGPLTHRSSVLRILNKYTLRAQLKPISPHILRHTFATQYLQANPADLRGLAALLGHSDLNTVMIYTEPTLQDLTDRLEQMSHLSVDE